MPKETFYNLPEDKRQKIFAAAVQEFSTQRFSEASINQVIKAAGIPRGSFYQYFRDKEDLFQYMYEQILKEKRDLMRQAEVLDPEVDVFELLLRTTKATFEWSRVRPEYSRISMLMELDNSDFITSLRTAAAEGLRGMVERDKARSLIKPDVDPDLLVDMIYALLLREYFWTGLDEGLFLKKLTDVITIIKEGVANVRSCHGISGNRQDTADDGRGQGGEPGGTVQD